MVKNLKTHQMACITDYVRRQLNKAPTVITKNFKFALKFTFLFFFFQGTERIKGQGAPVFQKKI